MRAIGFWNTLISWFVVCGFGSIGLYFLGFDWRRMVGFTFLATAVLLVILGVLNVADVLRVSTEH